MKMPSSVATIWLAARAWVPTRAKTDAYMKPPKLQTNSVTASGADRVNRGRRISPQPPARVPAAEPRAAQAVSEDDIPLPDEPFDEYDAPPDEPVPAAPRGRSRSPTSRW